MIMMMKEIISSLHFLFLVVAPLLFANRSVMITTNKGLNEGLLMMTLSLKEWIGKKMNISAVDGRLLFLRI